VTTVIVHGAGSTGAAAARLVGARADAVLVEDRSGDIERVIDLLRTTLEERDDCTEVVGVSLGAHALARWASTATPPLPRLICVLPAWTGDPGHTADATAASARSVGDVGITALLERLFAENQYSDVVGLLDSAWAAYTDAELTRCLERASTSRAPTAEELGAIRSHVTVVGWSGDVFHPDRVTREWARNLRRSNVAVAARPEIRLVQQALATCGALRPAPPTR
jgi:hypothetical protein